MTNEEALNQLDSTNPFMHGANYEAIKGYIETLTKCVEKQIPKKPVQKNGHYYCPNGCKSPIISLSVWQVGVAEKHCELCGQRLDWSEKENEN